MTPLKNEYEYFLILSETLNISRACEILDMQQGSLSKALKRLELEVGAPLFIRQGRGLLLTQRGTLLASQINSLKELWKDGSKKAEKKLDEIAGVISIGTHPITAIDKISTSIPKLIEDFPLLEIDLVLKKSGELVRDIIHHQLDLAIVANPLPHPNLVIKKIRDDYVGIWNASAKSKREEIIYYNPDMINVNRVLSKYKNYKKVAINNYDVLAQLAMNSKGLCILPSPVALKYEKLKLIEKIKEKVSICLIYHVDRPRTPTFNEVLGHFRIN
ncbi:MAG: LysR family transcriptional regulator [Oligoflexia bacterium]|nr:LysR family transcriptional regulator [Oligoflexia bacterium]